MIYKFLPSYVGSKKYWIDFLSNYKDGDFVELFSGSAVLSANLAKTAILNDVDIKVYQILSNFDGMIVPEIFTQEDYFKFRGSEDWWKYSYCFQKMSFSGVFRYSKNGYNVPVKKHIKEIKIRDEYLVDLERWKILNPTVYNLSYNEIETNLLQNKIVISDPPYEGSKASYNNKFNYEQYWNYINDIKDICKTLIIFDRKINLEKQNISVLNTRKMRVNGAYPGDIEAIAIYENGKWLS